jgi:tetratricopeptide (TPR) repeat protein
VDSSGKFIVKRQRSKKKAVIFQVLIFTFFCVRCFAIGDSIGNPAVPPAGARSGLVRNPLGAGSNINSGANSRGFAPYKMISRSGTSIGTGTIDESLYTRRSAPVTATRPQFALQPYYLLSGATSTVTSSAGAPLAYSGITSNKVTGESVTDELLRTEQQQTMMLAASPLYDYDRTRPLSYEPADLERVITYDQIREKNKEDLSNALQKASQGMNKIGGEEKSSLLPAEQEKEPLTQSTNLISESVEPIKRLEPVESFQPGQQPAIRPGSLPEVEAKTTVDESVYEQMLRQIAEAKQRQKVQSEQQQKTSEQEQAEMPEDKKPGDLRSELSEIQKETTEAVVGIHKSFATEAEDKFNYYMRTAEKFLNEGKYYRATDAYTLAGIYKPNDPLAYAGRSHALFASGEYMSSTYFLARAIDIFPQYVNFKIDLNAMIPDKDRLESRIVDIKQWIDKTKSAQLSFLLAYIYYQLDKLDLATEAIQFAQEEMPDSAAVKALKQVIEEKQ